MCGLDIRHPIPRNRARMTSIADSVTIDARNPDIVGPVVQATLWMRKVMAKTDNTPEANSVNTELSVNLRSASCTKTMMSKHMGITR